MEPETTTNLIRRIYTFGHGQPNFPGYVVAYGVDDNECRDRMNAAYGGVWSMEYLDEEQAGVEQWGLPLRATLGRAS